MNWNCNNWQRRQNILFQWLIFCLCARARTLYITDDSQICNPKSNEMKRFFYFLTYILLDMTNRFIEITYKILGISFFLSLMFYCAFADFLLSRLNIYHVLCSLARSPRGLNKCVSREKISICIYDAHERFTCVCVQCVVFLFVFCTNSYVHSFYTVYNLSSYWKKEVRKITKTGMQLNSASISCNSFCFVVVILRTYISFCMRYCCFKQEKKIFGRWSMWDRYLRDKFWRQKKTDRIPCYYT